MFDTYFDEVVPLVEKINKRKLNEYKMQLAIAQNPHVKDPKILWQEIEKQQRELSKEPEKAPQFDLTSFELLKQRVSENPRIIVKS